MGKTLRPCLNRILLGKHPHVHGEDALTAVNDFLKQETPPRAWGRRSKLPIYFSYCGNTPTCMGKTVYNVTLVNLSEKHPHVHGEDAVYSTPGHTL